MALPYLSVVSPVYGSPGTLEELRDRVAATARKIGVTHELVLVDDRCPKGSWVIVERLAVSDPNVVGVRLSRNFGQHAAIYAGLRLARGDWIVVMDCDLQDVPEEIERLHEAAQAGADAVRGLRSVRQDSLFRRRASAGFYRLLTYLTGVRHSAEVGNFGIYSRKLVDALLSWNEDHRYFPAAVQWAGFTVADVDVVHHARKQGVSSYTFRRLAALALGIVISFSDKPLRLVAAGGLLISGLAFLYALFLVVFGLLGGASVAGWTSVIASVWFLSGIIIFSIGFSGLYIGQILRETKGRPNYIIDRVVRADAAAPREDA